MAPEKSVLITGCSEGGIGHALAVCFQSRDFKVFASARDVSKIGSLATLPNVIPVKLDVSSAQQITAAKDLIAKETNGSLNYLINNAGRNHFMPVLDEDIEECKRIYETNVWGPLAVTQAFAPLVIKAKGHITNITSISGHVNVPWMGKKSPGMKIYH
jgi:1-acylglycerone phosphate reductase